MTCRQLAVPGSDGRTVRADVLGPDTAPAVLVLHGFKGFRRWGAFPWVGERLAARGLRAVVVDFSHNGVEEQDFDRLDLFLLDTPRRHQEDLAAVAEALPGPLGVLGHSRGGADALVFAAREPRVRAVVTWAAVAAFPGPTPEQDAALRRNGYVIVPNARTGQAMPVGRPAFEAAERPDVLGEAVARPVPTLAVHGTADESVPVASLERIQSALPHVDGRRIDGAGHTFGAMHPFPGPTGHLQAVTELSVAFLATHLLGGTTPAGRADGRLSG
ncbi:MAG: alpha/beta hydrolase family protein [Planctomycetota bacterium]